MASAAVPLPSNPAQNQGPELKRTAIALCVLSTLFIILRINVRAWITKVLGWDDWLIIVAGCSSIASMTVVTKAVDNGLGQHMGDLDLATMTKGLFWVFVVQSLLVFTQVVTKLSMAMTLLRIAVQRRYRMAIYITSGFMVVYLLVMLFIFNLNCKDVRSNWDPTVPRQCIPPEAMVKITYTIGSCNIVTDLLFAIIIPFPMIWQLQTNKRTKASAMFVISLGALACGASIARMPYLVSFGNTVDSLWAMAPVGLWSVVETEVAIIAVCIPALRPLFRTILESSFVTTYKARRTNVTPLPTGTYPNPKEFTQISERRRKSDDCESDGTSERGLVQRDVGVPLNAISKTTVSVVSVQHSNDERPGYPHRSYNTWKA